jgi:hypothetical protein
MDRHRSVVHSPGLTDRRCEGIAEGQHGVLGRSQALAAGLTEAAVTDRVERGEWIEVFPAVYRIAGAPPTERSMTMAAAIWSRGGFISHRSAGSLWELDGVPPQSEIELSAYVGAKRSGLMIHRIPKVDRPPLRVIDSIPVSAPERTIFDLCGVLHLSSAGRAIDDALRRGLTTLDRLWLEWETRGRRGRKGTRALRILLFGRDDRDGLLRSRLEAKMLRILKRIEGHEAIPNHRVSDGARVAYLDFAYPHLKLGIETHGVVWHTGERMKKDLVRDRWFKRSGWIVLYYSWDDVHLSARHVEEEIRTFLSSRLPVS